MKGIKIALLELQVFYVLILIIM